MAVGGIGGLVEVSVMQSTNYWKNAQQQGLPFTMDPRITYRGFIPNCVNFVSCTVFQFAVNGIIKKSMAGGAARDLSAGEQIAAAIGAGASSAVLGGPLELIMIQQQRKGGSMLHAAGQISSRGPFMWGRGFLTTALREGCYTGGYLGVTPVIRERVQNQFPTWSEDGCRLVGSIFGALFACALSHPADTLKTCLQGDIEGSVYKTHLSTADIILKESGLKGFYRGVPWRLFRQVGGIFILDKIRVSMSPMLFPHRFKGKTD